MTKSATTRPINLSKPQPQPQIVTPVKNSWGRVMFTLIFRTLLLAAGGSLTAAVGVAVAQLYPSQAQEPPLLETLIQKSESLFNQVQHLPQTWNQPAASSAAPIPVISAASLTNTPLTNASLTNTERQQLQAELTQLQAELQTLTSKSPQPLVDRVQQIQKRTQTIQERLNSFTSAATNTAQTAQIAEAKDSPANSADHLKVTLPSDALFDEAQTTLKPGTEAILSNISTDLQRYPGATIQVMAHTDSQGSSETDRHRSLEQAKAVRQYLSTKLKDDVHWVAIGYGHNYLLVPDSSSENQQRNRRIEIVIQPKS
jgi:peptidoglycan-associated lipoprotein